jgi:hypothetical protein
MRLDWYGERRESWWELAGTVARRFHLVKASVIGAPALWLAIAVALGLSLVATWRIVREARARA